MRLPTTRVTTGHPTRALAGLAVLLVAWIGYRVPAMRADYNAALGTADAVLSVADESRKRPRPVPVHKTTMMASLPQREERLSRSADVFAEPRHFVRHPGEGRDLAVVRSPVSEHARPLDSDLGRDDELAQKFRLPDVPAAPPAGKLATDAYARLAAGDRRAAADLFAAAIARGGDPRVGAWTAARARLTRRWSGNAYSIFRARGPIDLAVTPVLGGGQSGAGLAFTPDPLARRPLALTVRGAVAHDDGDSALAALGVAWRLRPGLTLAAERVVALGSTAEDAWTVRLAGGAAGRRGLVVVSAYGEAGVVGEAVYGAAQARAAIDLAAASRLTIAPGIGAWASFQHDARGVGRVDLGPGVRLRHAALPVEIAVDYRTRIAGNAAPGSGLVFTVSTDF